MPFRRMHMNNIKMSKNARGKRSYFANQIISHKPTLSNPALEHEVFFYLSKNLELASHLDEIQRCPTTVFRQTMLNSTAEKVTERPVFSALIVILPSLLNLTTYSTDLRYQEK
jgi:hypothetical protein